MKRDLLVVLLRQIKELKNIETMQKLFAEKADDLSWIFQLTDDEVKTIIGEEQEELKFAKMYLYLKGGMLSEQYEKIIEKAIEDKNDNIAVVLDLLENDKLVARQDAKNILEAIIQARSISIANSICAVARDSNILAREDALEFVKVVARAKGLHQAQYASVIACDSNVLAREDALEFVKVVASAEEDYQAQYACDTACDSNVLEKEDALDFVKIVVNAETEELSKYASVVARDPDVLKREDALAVVRRMMVGKIEGPSYPEGEEVCYKIDKLMTLPQLDGLISSLEQTGTSDINLNTTVVVKQLKNK